ncbi:MAG TPA: hypothetical protein PKX05_04635, partial [bacterium]|nr:hypothetical protein [bacterium]
MRKIRNLFAMLMFIVTGFVYPATQDSAPFNYVFGKAYHILPGTHNKESGYFSLCEGLDGKIYIGTTKYNENSFLVEFDPYTEKQKIVIDTHKVCGIQATGYAAQAKIHTKNFVAPSGRIYVGSKEGYRSEGDNSEYPGGYVMVYDPGTQKAESLGMPQPNEGIIDVVADEGKKLLYVVTSEGKHWFVYDMKTKKYRQIGTMLSPYATTLIDKKGRAHVITKDFKIATYTPETDSIVIRPIIISGKVFTYPKPTITYWVLASDKKTAYMTMMSDSQLYEIILPEKEKTVKGKNLGRMIQGSNPDCRSSLCIHPDGRVYCLWRIFNETGFGSGNLHHLIRYNPKNKKMEDLGVIAVKNPDYFDFNSHALGNPLTFSHGFHKLPDGTLTPLYEHMAMIATRDGTLYITILYPFTLLKIDQFTIPEKNLAPGDFGFAAKQYFKAVLDACDRVESHLLEITQTAEIIADRHINGGLIGFYPSNYQGFEDEFWGRSGGMVNMGFDRPFKQNRT